MLESCAYCGEDTEHLDDLRQELCPDCEDRDLVQCCGCGDYYNIEDMIDDDCVLCVTNYRR